MTRGRPPAAIQPRATAAAPPARLVSLDALRGFDMFWIVGAEGLVKGLHELADTGVTRTLAGRLLKAPKPSPARKVLLLAGWGIAGVVLGWAWHPAFPVVKKIWTSSYVLVSSGWSAILLAGFYWAVDVRGLRRPALPFVWLGANALAVYLLHNIVNVNGISSRLVGGDIAKWAGPCAGLLLSATTLGLTFLVARFLYLRRIFIKL
jgi:predicted acyltransferase